MADNIKEVADDHPTEAVRTLRLNRIVPDEMRAIFSNHVVVRHSGKDDEFMLYFFEVNPPIYIEGDDDLENIDSVNAYCVAKVVMTRKRMAGLIAALAENYAKTQSVVDSDTGGLPGDV